mmetsp:Transcript_11866/g.24483  ORF Transcript_11866/g.24483 Transcript_11866/m.24483 type:complete len:85 (-) Transcript_11866:280-534(-)
MSDDIPAWALPAVSENTDGDESIASDPTRNDGSAQATREDANCKTIRFRIPSIPSLAKTPPYPMEGELRRDGPENKPDKPTGLV